MDFEDVYGLFFVTIVVLLLIVSVNYVLGSYDSVYSSYWKARDLENCAQKYAGKTLDAGSLPEGFVFIDLETGGKYGDAEYSYGLGYPVLLLVDGDYHAGRVIAFE